MTSFGAWSLVPAAVVVAVALKTRRAFEPLLIGCLVGYLMIDWTKFPGNFLDSLIKTLQDESLVWVIVVCALYGSLIQLMVVSGGIAAFGDYLLRYLTTRRRTLVGAWLLGVAIFMDDYLSALTVSSIMRRVTDRFRVPRELLAMMVNSTAAPVCVIIPLSTWSLYVGKLLEGAKLAAPGQGNWLYMKTIPFNFYAIFMVVIAGLVAAGWMPVVGRMKRAVRRSEASADPADLVPAGSEPFTNRLMLPVGRAGKSRYFLVPLLVLVGVTLATGLDALKGAAVAVTFTVAYFSIDRVLRYDEALEGVWEGARGMLFTLVVLVMSYVLKNVGDAMGMTQFIVDGLRANANPKALPALIFLSLGLVTFATGSSWGVYAVTVPIVVALAAALGLSPWPSLGAVVAAGAFGSQACFYSDAAVLTATGTECNNIEHGLTQFPYALLAFALGTVAYLAVGYLG